jgi:hypothetical protein
VARRRAVRHDGRAFSATASPAASRRGGGPSTIT